MSRLLQLLVAGLVALTLGAGAAHAQQPDTAAAPSPQAGQGKGVATLLDWPASLPQLLREMGTDAPYLLPRIDSLALEYRYASNDSTSQWSFVLGWRPSQRVLYEGDILPVEQGPPDVRMVNVELRADVQVGDESVGEMIIAVDSMALRPLPSIYSFEVTVGHDRVFLDATTEEARRALARGVTLDSLVVERMGFTSAAPSTSERRRRPDVRERRPAPRRGPSIYEPRTRIFIGWRVAPRPYYVFVKDGRRTVQPRDESIGRGATAADDTRARAARRGEADGDESDDRRRTSDEDDEDEEPSLRGPALGAAAAIGIVAYAGGTLGLYGRGDTPIGLAAGYTHPRGGIQLHAAVNAAVIEGESGQKLTLKALGFYDVFEARIQPAVGLGVQIDPGRAGNVVPAASVGLAGNFGRVVAFGGVDVVQATPEMGLAYNFRYQSRE